MRFVAAHSRGEKKVESEPLELPADRTARDFQPVIMTCFDEMDSGANGDVTVHEGDKQTPVFNDMNEAEVDRIPLRNNECCSFTILRPAQRVTTILNLQWNRHTMPVMLPRELFSRNEPIRILAGNWRMNETAGAPVVQPAPGTGDTVEPDPEQILAMTEVPVDVAHASGLEEGRNTIDNIYNKEDFLKSLCTNLVGTGGGSAANGMDLLREFFPGKTFYLKQYNGRYFVILKGLAGTREPRCAARGMR